MASKKKTEFSDPSSSSPSVLKNSFEYNAPPYQNGKLAVLRSTEFMQSPCHLRSIVRKDFIRDSYIQVDIRPNGSLALVVHPGDMRTDIARAVPTWYPEFMQDNSAMPVDTIVFIIREKRMVGRSIHEL